jgi:hypothetical protein
MALARELWGMRHLASVRRRDGHTIDGVPGDCFRCALAYLCGTPADFVPHLGLRLSWWWDARRWVREQTGDRWDLYYIDLEDPENHLVPPMPADQDDFDPNLVMLGGPSPRGPWSHVVVGLMEPGLPTVFDPHPSGAGVERVTEVYLIRPSLPWPVHGIPDRLALAAS